MLSATPIHIPLSHLSSALIGVRSVVSRAEAAPRSGWSGGAGVRSLPGSPERRGEVTGFPVRIAVTLPDALRLP